MTSIQENETYLVATDDDDTANKAKDLPPLESPLDQKYLFKVAVNPGVTYANLIAIPVITGTIFMMLTFQNAQIIFLLADP
jgi:hypothetical protein